MKTREELREEARVVSQQKLETAYADLTVEMKRRKLSFESSKQQFGNERYTFTRIEGRYMSVEVKAVHGKSRLEPYTWKIRIIIGGYRDKKQFHERKEGFDFKIIVQEIVNRLDSAKFAEANDLVHKRLREQLEAQVARIKSSVGEVPSASVRVFDSSGLRIEGNGLSETQAEVVMRLLQSFHTGVPEVGSVYLDRNEVICTWPIDGRAPGKQARPCNRTDCPHCRPGGVS